MIFCGMLYNMKFNRYFFIRIAIGVFFVFFPDKRELYA